MERGIEIDGKEYRLVANGATPRIYRGLFHKDVFSGMANAVGDDMTIKDFEVFENLAFCMAMQGGSISTGETIDNWLGTMSSPLAIVNVAPQLMELWAAETETTSTAKKE